MSRYCFDLMQILTNQLQYLQCTFVISHHFALRSHKGPFDPANRIRESEPIGCICRQEPHGVEFVYGQRHVGQVAENEDNLAECRFNSTSHIASSSMSNVN